MEGLWDKYNRIKEVFYRDFVYDSSYTEQASCIPLSSVKNGAGWDGMRDLINNADEDVDCITSATEKSSMYRNDSFFVFV